MDGQLAFECKGRIKIDDFCYMSERHGRSIASCYHGIHESIHFKQQSFLASAEWNPAILIQAKLGRGIDWPSMVKPALLLVSLSDRGILHLGSLLVAICTMKIYHVDTFVITRCSRWVQSISGSMMSLKHAPMLL
jgi:hypothetical protein